MKWGQRWGDFWGSNKKVVTDVRATRSSSNPGEVNIAADVAESDAKLHVHVDGYKRIVTSQNEFSMPAPSNADAVVEIVPTGPNSGDHGYTTDRFLDFQAFAYRTLEWQRGIIVESNDDLNQLSNWVINGILRNSNQLDWENSRKGKLYIDLTGNASTRLVRAYKDAGKATADRVFQGNRTGDGSITLDELNDSDLSGTVDVVFTSNDTDIELTYEIPTKYRVRWDNATGTIIESDLAVIYDDGESDTFRWSTPKMNAGTYKFRVDWADAAGNWQTGAVTSITIDLAPAAVSNLALSYNPGTQKVTLTWTDPADADLSQLEVRQWLDGSAPPTTPTATVAAGVQTWESGVLTGANTYKFRVNTKDTAGNVEQSSTTKQVELDAAHQEVSPRPNGLFSISVTSIAGGKFEVVADYSAEGEAAAATKVNFFHDAGGGGGVDWNTIIGTVTLSQVGGFKRAKFESGAFTDGTDVEWGARAVTAGDVDDGTTDKTATAKADATAIAGSLPITVKLGRWDSL